jgi:hypothetical protein
LRGGVDVYAAQASLKIDAAMAEKHRFRTESHQISLVMINSGWFLKVSYLGRRRWIL